MNYKKLLSGITVSCLSIPFLSVAENSKPNILILIADDVSLNDFGCYGHPIIKTPNIDALAKDGIRFTNTFLTTSSSSPSRSSIITGRYPHNTGACELHSPMGDEQISIAELLKNTGYYCAQAGKWHFGASPLKPDGPASRGFDRTGGGVNDGGGESGSEKWISFLQERPKNKPFFMWFASHDAHRPWDSDQSLERYNPDKVEITRFFIDDKPTRQDFANYYFEVTRFDYYVGKVIKELKAQGVYKNTFIIVMADNGRPFPRSKTRLNTDGIKTPFIVHYPAAVKQKGQVCNRLLSVIDIAPTLSEIARIKSSPTFQGRSFLTLLSNPQKKFRKYVFAEHNWHSFEALERMVCTEKYLLIENKRPQLNAIGASDIVDGDAGCSLIKGYKAGKLNEFQYDLFKVPRPTIELYEFENDKDQLNNIALNNKKVADKLIKVLRQWQKDTGDSYPAEITPDWYKRDTLEKLPTFNIRKEMPGASNKAILINKRGPF